MKAEPQKEHDWLRRLVGDWTYETEAGTPPPAKAQGTENVRSLGGLWIVAEGQGEMPGGSQAVTLMTLGYDPQKQRYVGTWIGTMMTYLWVYDGALDASGNVMTLDSEGPGMTGDGTMAKYQDIIEFKSDDHRILSSQVLGEDGKWNRIMTVHYRRRT